MGPITKNRNDVGRSRMMSSRLSMLWSLKFLISGNIFWKFPKKTANATPSIATPSTTPSTSTSATPSKREEVDVNATPKTSSPKSKISDAAKTPKTSSTPKVSKPSPSILMFAKKLTKAEQDEQRLKVIRESKPKPAPAPTPKAPVKQQPTIIDLTQN